MASSPACPVVTATPAQTSVTLNWSADTNATDGYRIIWKQGSSVLSVDTYPYSPSMTATKTGLSASTTYSYQVSPLVPGAGNDEFGFPIVVQGCSTQTFTTTA